MTVRSDDDAAFYGLSKTRRSVRIFLALKQRHNSRREERQDVINAAGECSLSLLMVQRRLTNGTEGVEAQRP